MRAIDAVERYESSPAIDMLADALRYDADAAVRAHAAIALSSIGGDDVVQALEAGLGDRSEEVRAEVLHGLGMVGGERATLAIAQALFSSAELELRAVAVEALAAQGTEQARLFLEAALEDEHEAVREQARLALQR
jgi:HEAT repeat protein